MNIKKENKKCYLKYTVVDLELGGEELSQANKGVYISQTVIPDNLKSQVGNRMLAMVGNKRQ